MSKINLSEISSILMKELDECNYKNSIDEIGNILEVGDGVVRAYGLNNIESGELVLINNDVEGIALNIEQDNIGIVLLGDTKKVKEGDLVKRTKKIASIPVGKEMLGRVVNTLGNPIDGKGKLTGNLINMPLERKAPGVIYREPVTEPIQTGIIAIDAMIPIGKGQRELIIGDRQTGKTTIAIDTILNQKKSFKDGNPIYCIYVAIGQKSSTVAQIFNILLEKEALDYTIIVAANASDPAAMQVYAPFAGTAIGEFFRDTGHSCLIIYDDLSKQAVAYREISLLLRRPPGREAYPGDVFYLHSRLLERSAKIISDNEVAKKMNDLPVSLQNKIRGGGSLTALPIIETQAGDVSAYIPTNVISITDGQIFLDSDLFNSGIKPAINTEISVSRVGGAAQINSMKKVSGKLKIDQAQYRELEAFSKFGSDIDSLTTSIISKGERNLELLKQPINSPISIEEQIVIIYLGTNNLLEKIPINQIKKFQYDYISLLKRDHIDILNELKTGVLNERLTLILHKKALELINDYY